MPQRFNFYDLYGYLIPGFTFLALLCLPHGLAKSPPWWPPASWGSAVGVLGTAAVCYLAGHVLQDLAASVWVSRGLLDYRLLQPADHTFSAQLKAVLAAKIEACFGIDVSPPAESPHFKALAHDAFLLCRGRLVQRDAGSYAEQQQGMEALMRGLTVAYLLGAAHHLGWAVGAGWLSTLRDALLGIDSRTGLGLLFAAYLILRAAAEIPQVDKSSVASDDKPPRWRRLPWLWWAAVVMAVSGGSLGARTGAHDLDSIWTLLGISATAAVLALKCWRLAVGFRRNFAAMVFRDFAALATEPAAAAGPGRNASP